ncbi:hypothetical protein GCM10010399_08660 [Dactylosporangium fulvum]|uniref:Methyltransferase domain-containing protein n=1 Tax=Dactylosporangium fulvum TaxID=53359 RepID=A0ABY5WAI2_9ACTN|nr:class I SAM-dependent methyltransferase [Dactylosporangium fulvum]UWP86499.1 methyltransferase domain-containing protein [Dactylosporangium fulvum]
MSREWDARTYDSLPLPHTRWSRRTLALLTLRGDETVLDVGAGTGRDAAALLDLLPRGRVIALDGSERMLRQLRANLAGRMERVDIVHADLNESFRLDRTVDAVFSVATFHWIHDHAALFGRVAAVLTPGGQFAAECGGTGCVAQVRRAVEAVLGRPADAAYYADVDETVRALTKAGFEDIEAELIDDPFRLQPGERLRAYLGAVVLGPYLDRMPAGRHEWFLGEVEARLAEPVIDYVRLSLRAQLAPRDNR